MSTSRSSFSMTCPVCDDDVDDIEAEVYIGSRTEHFWGAPVRVDESECDIVSIPPCPTCGKVTVDSDVAAEYYWDSVHE